MKIAINKIEGEEALKALEEVLSLLKKVFNEKETELPNNEPPFEPPIGNDVVFKIMKKLKLPSIEKTYDWLRTFDELYPNALLNILLKEIAVMMDKQYPDHIKHSPEYYVISTADGKIYKYPKEAIKSYKTVALFRNKRDIEYAYSLVKNIADGLFDK